MADTDLMADGAMTIFDAEKFTTLKKTHLYALMKDGSLPFAKLGKRRMIPKRALVELLKSGLVKGEATPGAS